MVSAKRRAKTRPDYTIDEHLETERAALEHEIGSANFSGEIYAQLNSKKTLDFLKEIENI